jgi:hypothetical protein
METGIHRHSQMKTLDHQIVNAECQRVDGPTCRLSVDLVKGSVVDNDHPGEVPPVLVQVGDEDFVETRSCRFSDPGVVLLIDSGYVVQ